MKKIKFSILAIIFAAVSFTSCDNEITPDTTAAPVITFTEGDATITNGGDVSISGNIFAEGELSEVVIKKIVDGVTTTLETVTSFDIKTSHDFVFDFTDVTEPFSITVEATDDLKEPQTRTETATISLDAGVVTNDAVKIYCALKSHYQAQGGDFASATTGETFTYNEALNSAEITAKIDFWFYYSNLKVLRPVMVSPDLQVSVYHDGDDGDDIGEVFPNANSTTFVILDDVTAFSDWDAVNTNTLADLTGITNNTADGMAVDDIVAFETQDGKKGVFKVTELNVSAGLATEYIVVDIIIQENAPVTK